MNITMSGEDYLEAIYVLGSGGESGEKRLFQTFAFARFSRVYRSFGRHCGA